MLAKGPATELRGTRIAAALLIIALTTSLASCGGGGNDAPRPTTFPIATGLRSASAVAAAWGGERYLITFSEERSDLESDVFGLRLTRSGDAIDPTPLLLSDFGSDFFLTANVRYSPGGIAFANGAFGAFLFGTGTIAEGPPGQVVGFVAVPESGAPLLPATAVDEQVSFSTAQTSLSAPIAVTTNGALFLAMYQRILTMLGSFSLSEVFGQIVTPSASGIETQPVGPLSGVGIPVEGMVTDGSPPGVAIGATATLVAWVETVADLDAPFATSTRLGGVLLTPSDATFVQLGDTTEGSRDTLVASDGAEFLVVWTATTSASEARPSEVRALRVGSNGSASPAGGFLVAGGSSAKDLGDVAFAQGVYLVTWIEDGALRGARLGTAGTEAEAFTIDAGPVISAALASDGARFLAVFDRPAGASESDVLGRFVPLD